MDISVTIHNKRKHKQSIKDKDTSRAFDKIPKKATKNSNYPTKEKNPI